MNLEHLGYILEIQRCKSINRASKNLFVSQSNLSTVLKSIENELGYAIFERTSTGVCPTVYGQQFLLSAEIMYNEYARLRTESVPPRESSSLSISAAYSSFLSSCFFDFITAHPAAQDDSDIYREAILEQSLHDLMNNHVRMIVSYISQLDVTRYGTYARRHNLAFHPQPQRLKMYVALGHDHPLAGRESLSFNDLRGYPLVVYDTAAYEDIPEPLRPNLKQNLLYVSCRATFYDAIALGGYCAPTLNFADGEAERRGCVCVPVRSDPLVLTFFWQNGYELNSRESAWYDYMLARLRALPPSSLASNAEEGQH